MQPLRLEGALLTTVLTLAASRPAWAHVEISPYEVPSDASKRFTASVPTEKDVPTTGVKIEVPNEFAVSSAQKARGQRVSQEKNASGETTAFA